MNKVMNPVGNYSCPRASFATNEPKRIRHKDVSKVAREHLGKTYAEKPKKLSIARETLGLITIEDLSKIDSVHFTEIALDKAFSAVFKSKPFHPLPLITVASEGPSNYLKNSLPQPPVSFYKKNA